jgi:hypothetical protein
MGGVERPACSYGVILRIPWSAISVEDLPSMISKSPGTTRGPASGKRAAIHQHVDCGSSGGEDGLDQVFLDSCQIQIGYVMAFAIGGLVMLSLANHDNRGVRSLGGAHGFCEPVLVGPGHFAAQVIFLAMAFNNTSRMLTTPRTSH